MFLHLVYGAFTAIRTALKAALKEPESWEKEDQYQRRRKIKFWKWDQVSYLHTVW